MRRRVPKRCYSLSSLLAQHTDMLRTYFPGIGAELTLLVKAVWKPDFWSFTKVFRFHTQLSPKVQSGWIHEPLIFTDSLGRVVPLHLELVDSWEVGLFSHLNGTSRLEMANSSGRFSTKSWKAVSLIAQSKIKLQKESMSSETASQR
jgi:hypothetical protein